MIIARARIAGSSFQEEAVEMALAELMGKLRRYSDDNLPGLFARMVRNRVIDVYRKQVKRREELPEWKEPGHVPDHKSREIALALHDCVARLKDAQREVMRELLDGLSLQAVATHLNKPANTVISHKHRSLPLLRRCLESKGFHSYL